MNLTPQELAERFRVTTSTLATWRMTGQGPTYIKFGRKVLYPLAEIEAFEQARLRRAVSVK